MSNLQNFSKTFLFVLALGFILPQTANAQLLLDKAARETKRTEDLKVLQERFSWWPTDAKPAPVKDADKGGYWWWPTQPGSADAVKQQWGNRGYIYLNKIIYDYKADEEAEETAKPAAKELKPSLLIKKIIKNVKIYFDYNKANLRDDHYPILKKVTQALDKNPQSSILITGNCDARGSDEYNLKLGKKRGEVVKNYMLENGIPEERIKIVSRGKLDAVAPVKDIIGMQKDRNAQFMVAEVEEVMMAQDGDTAVPAEAKPVEEGKYVVEEKQNVESAPKASTREYTIQPNDSLWKIAQKEMGNGNRWQYLYELNKDRIKNPNKLKKGTVIIIPVE